MRYLYTPLSFCLSVAKMHLLLFALLRFEKKLAKSTCILAASGLLACILLPILYSNGIISAKAINTIPPFLALACTIVGSKQRRQYILGTVIFVLASFFEAFLAAFFYGILHLDAVTHIDHYTQNLMLEALSAGLIALFVYFARLRKPSELELWLDSKYSFGLYFMLIGLLGLLMYVFPIQYSFLITNAIALKRSFIGLSVSSLVFIAANLISYVSIIKSERLKGRTRLYEGLLEEQKRYYADMIEKEQKIHSLKHDMESHLLTVSTLLDSMEYQKAITYIQGLYTATNSLSGTQYNSGNKTLDMVLHQFKDNEKAVKLEINGCLPESINVKDIDLCILFSNLLKNAIAAALPGESIQVELLHVAGNLQVKVSNPIHTPVSYTTGRPVRSSGDGGFGIRNICDVAEKYNGFYSFTSSEDTFLADVILLNVLC